MWLHIDTLKLCVCKPRFFFLFLLASFPSLVVGQSQIIFSANNIASMSLAELVDLEITSVAKKQIPLAQAPAALYVITAKHIRRSGAQNLVEALRLAPNLQVARISASQYAISARGFNSSTSNKLQVVIDGRIVYTPLYSGVFWDAQDVVLDDIERIEVISGPADAAWGANAVNGVINIITRNAKDSQGQLISASTNDQIDTLAMRHGGEFQTGTHYRVYGKWSDYAHTYQQNNTASEDAWHLGQLGFRVDNATRRRKFNIQGDAYSGKLQQPQPGEREISGFNLTARLENKLQNGSVVNVLGYYDYTYRNYPGTFVEDLKTFYLELRQDLDSIGSHDIQWGLAYRLAEDNIENSASLAFLPANKKLQWPSFFAQDEIAIGDQVRLTVSARIEKNDYSGTEVMPTARIAWSPTTEILYWAAVSRTVRAPSRIDRDFYIPGEEPYFIQGGPDFDSESALVYQLGYRALFTSASSFSISLFRAEYSDLRSLELLDTGASELANGMEASTFGAEIWGVYQISDNWHLQGGLLVQDQEFRLKPESTSTISREGNDPEYQWSLKSALNLGFDKEFDITVRRVGQLTSPEVPAYTALDMRFVWWINSRFLVSLDANNLAKDDYVEFGNPQTGVVTEQKISLSTKIWFP